MVIPVSTMQWRVKIEIFNARGELRFLITASQRANCTSFFCSLGICFVFVIMLLVCRDIELNPGPRKRNTYHNFSFCHWNLDSIAAHNFEKVDFLEAYNTVNKFDIIFLSAPYLDSSMLSDI